jgi:hypothetical protein
VIVDAAMDAAETPLSHRLPPAGGFQPNAGQSGEMKTRQVGSGESFGETDQNVGFREVF